MKTCKCGREFEPVHPHQKYCTNPECKRQRMNYNNRKSVEKKRKANMCECCEVRPKAPGFRKLCKWCHQNAGDNDENSIYIPGVRTVFV